MRRPVPGDLPAAIWAHRALRTVRSRLAAGELHEIRLGAPGRLALGGRRGVTAVLLLRRASCLEGALVRQRFQAALGEPRDVVIGVGRASDSFGAHAWLDGERDGERMGLHELARVTATAHPRRAPRAAAPPPAAPRPSDVAARTRTPGAS